MGVRNIRESDALLFQVLFANPTPKFSIGSVIVGDEAGVSISGTVNAPVLNFTLPRYAPGGFAIDDNGIMYSKYGEEG